jgi:excisionase family DNA binding protein
VLNEIPLRGFTVRDVAQRFRVSPDKVRRWICSGELRAVNVASTLCGKPLWRITPEAVEEFEKLRGSVPPPKPANRRKRAKDFIDFYPDTSPNCRPTP